jgi:tRNA (cytidine/uridine-2'-O-)-methyltransferase
VSGTVAGMHVVLVEPQIAPNTGNIIRLCANTGAELHLVEPLGFDLDDAKLKRGGLDYHEHATVTVHRDLDTVARVLGGRWFAFSSHGTHRYTGVEFRDDDVLVFGSERFGLGAAQLSDPRFDAVLTIPQRPGMRSLNLGNAVSIVVYEAWRQLGFAGAEVDGGNGPLTVETLTADGYDA